MFVTRSLLLTYSLTLDSNLNVTHSWRSQMDEKIASLIPQMNNSRDRGGSLKQDISIVFVFINHSRCWNLHETCIRYTISITHSPKRAREWACSKQIFHSWEYRVEPISADDRTIKRWMSLICQIFDDHSSSSSNCRQIAIPRCWPLQKVIDMGE